MLDPATREAYAATPRELAAFGRPADLAATLYRPGEALAVAAATAAHRHLMSWWAWTTTLRRLIHEGASEAR